MLVVSVDFLVLGFLSSAAAADGEGGRYDDPQHQPHPGADPEHDIVVAVEVFRSEES